MASRPGAVQRPNGIPREKICQFKLVLLGEFVCLQGYSLTIVVTVGESAVGKSSLVLRFVKGQFHEYQESTIGGSFCPLSSRML